MEYDSADIKSYIYQQISEFSPFVTPETVVYVVTRNPKDDNLNVDEDEQIGFKDKKHRIAIILEENGTSLESEVYHDDLFEAIKLAKSNLITRLVEIQAEMEESGEFDSEDLYDTHSEPYLH